MPGLNLKILCHSLNIKPGSKAVKQGKQNIHLDIEMQVKEEVEKLIAIGFINPIKHPTWLANIMLVKKKSGQV